MNELRIAAAARKYMRWVAAFDAEAITRSAFRSGQGMTAPLISAIERETPLRSLSWKEVWLRGLELCAQAMEFREDAIYDSEMLTGRMLAYARQGEQVRGMNEWSISENARLGSRELVSYFYRALSALGEFPSDCVRLLAEYPDEAAAALYLRCADGE